MMHDNLHGDHFIDWLTVSDYAPYMETVTVMEQLVADIADGKGRQSIWYLEHPSIYTLGVSAKPKDVLNPSIPCFIAGRGGQVTYHGPGQRVVYVMVDLRQHGMDIRLYIHKLQNWIIATLKVLGIECWAHTDRIGIWVTDKTGAEAKIAAIGVKVKKWITYHGFAININPDLGFFRGIVPCGLPDYAVTSLEDLGVFTSMANLDIVLTDNFHHFLK